MPPASLHRETSRYGGHDQQNQSQEDRIRQMPYMRSHGLPRVGLCTVWPARSRAATLSAVRSSLGAP